MDTVKIGMIGCGGIGKHHSNYLRKIPGAAITAASDVSDTLLDAYKKEYGAAGYKDYNDMLAKETLDAVLICLPTFLHFDAVKAAAGKKIAIFCEKPLTRNFSDAEKIRDLVAKEKLLFQVGFVRRFDNFWGKAKEIVDSGVLGSPVVWRHTAVGAGPASPWFLDKERGGGPIIDGMIHNFDFASLMFGKSVKAVSGLTKFKQSTSLDTGSVWLEYERGDVMANFWSWGLAEKVSSFGGMDIMGPKGVLLFSGSFDAKEFEGKFDAEKEAIFVLRTAGGKNEMITYKKNDMFHDQMVHFTDCVRNNKEPFVTVANSLQGLHDSLAALQELSL
ncbi:MAG: Gfo/Idh/MocA family oxidoreductase [Spirochaetota bacterium]